MAVLIIFPVILQPVINLIMMSIGGHRRGAITEPYSNWTLFKL